MRILIVGMNYAPELTGIGPFTTGLAEHLVSQGHEVTVTASFPHFPHWTFEPQYLGRLRDVEREGGVEVRRCAVILPPRRSLVGRLLYDWSFTVGSILNCWGARRADVVVVVSPPIQAGLVGALLARAWRAASILLVKDLPLEAAVSVGLMRRGFLYNVGRRLERLVYRWADRIVVISPGFVQSVAAQGVSRSKIEVIPDWANLDAITPKPPDIESRAKLGATADDFLVLYTGNIGQKQGLEAALGGAALAREERWCKLTFIGEGSEKTALQAAADRMGLSNIRFLPLQPAEQLPRILSAADALLLHQRSDVVDSVAPSKLLSYMAAGRPILSAVHTDSVAARLVREAACGLVVPPEDGPALWRGICELRRDAARREVFGQSGRRFVERHFAKDQVLGKWVDLLAQVDRRPGRAGQTVS